MLVNLLPNDFPACNGGIVFLNVAEDQAAAFKTIRPDLARSHVSRVGSHFRQMNNPLLLHVDLVPATIGEAAIRGSEFFLRRDMYRIGPFWPVGIHKVSAHVTIALVHEEALAMGPERKNWPSGAVFHGFFCGNELPRTHDLITYLRFSLTKR